MNKVIKLVNVLKPKIGKRVQERIKEFENVKNLFSELCFCILTANYNAERAIEIQQKIGKGFTDLDEKELAVKLREFGYRYPNTRAGYILEARNYRKELEEVLKSLQGEQLREWLVKNIKGIGYKEASHFLRNIGFKDYSIIDFHIVDFLIKNKLIVRPKSLAKKYYLDIEEILKNIAKECKLNLSELDLYLWYNETGKILK